MSAFFIYLFKVCCWIAIWWLVYLFFLRKETFYSFNRVYLMTGLAASFLIPLITVHYPVEIFLSLTSNATAAENHASSPIDVYSILFYPYLFFGALFIIHQLFLLSKIILRIRSSGYTIVDNFRLVDSPDVKIPFSFCNYIFLNSHQLPEEEKQLILAHERSHINRRHRIDLAIAESACIFLWFNPFVWLYQQSIKENHEYLADKEVISSGYSPVNYRAALINQILSVPVFALANSFTSSKFKRISMMKKETSNPLKKLAALLLIPAAGFSLWAFAEPEYHVTTGEAPQQISVVSMTANDSVAHEKAKPHKVVVKITSKLYLNDTLRSETYQDSSPLIIIDGVESSESIEKLDPKQIKSVSGIKDTAAAIIYMQNGKYTTCDDSEHPHFYFNLTRASYVKKGKNGVVLITTKKITQ